MSLASKAYTGTSPSASEIDSTFDSILGVVNGDIDNQNLKKGEIFDVSQIANAADTRGCEFTGNIVMASGALVDGVDVDQLENTVNTLSTNISNKDVVRDGVLMASGTVSADTASALTTFLDAKYPDLAPITDADYDIECMVAVADIEAPNGRGINKISISVSSSYSLTCAFEDENDATISNASVTLRYFIQAIPKGV